jgi:hypothetical protein
MTRVENLEKRHPDELLRLAARAIWDGRPPSAVADWLAERGIGTR